MTVSLGSICPKCRSTDPSRKHHSVAKEPARDLFEDVTDKVKEEASKLTEPLREYEQRKAAERTERQRRETAEQAEREIDDEIAALKKKLGKD